MLRRRVCWYIARFQTHCGGTTNAVEGTLRPAGLASELLANTQTKLREQRRLLQTQRSSAEKDEDGLGDGPQGRMARGQVQQLGISLETGELAPLADGAAIARSGSSSVLTAVVCEQPPQPLWKARVYDNFLEVNYQERFSAGGRIPRTALRREMGPTFKEMGVAQLVQSALEPMFEPGFASRCQVHSILVSSEDAGDSEVLAINAAAAALSNSDIPWAGPIAAVRVARLQGKEGSSLLVNPSTKQLQQADMSILYAGTAERCTLFELQGRRASLEEVQVAMQAARAALTDLLLQQQSLADSSREHKRSIPSLRADPAALFNASRFGRPAVDAIMTDSSLSHADRSSALRQAREDLEAKLRAMGMFRLEHMRVPGSGCASPKDIDSSWEQIQAAALRFLVLSGHARPDGRGFKDARQPSSRVAFLNAVHGSALLNLGSTQVMSVATVGNDQDGLITDTVHGPENKRFLAHFTCPSFALNEMKARSGDAKRAEVAGSRILEAALSGVVPRDKHFPFTVRLTADVLALDGSAASAAVTSGSLALINAGVPITAPVAGVSIGLVCEEGIGEEGNEAEGWEVLVDAGGLEEDLGAMQLTAAGTREGFTLLQLNAFMPGGIPVHILEAGVAAASRALPGQLDYLESVIKQDMVQRAHFSEIEVGKDNIKRVIGTQGSNVKALEADTGAKVVVRDEGIVNLYAPTKDKYTAAETLLETFTGADVKEGVKYKVRVVRLMDYGAFVELPNGFQALLHISELAHHKVRSVEDELEEGEELQVLCQGRDSRGHVKVSRKALLPLPPGSGAPPASSSRPAPAGRRDWLGAGRPESGDPRPPQQRSYVK
ncbi:g8796 [Coccomyxa elongata]